MSAKRAAIRRERKERRKAENRKAPDGEARRAAEQGRIDGRTLAACIIINVLYDQFGFRDKRLMRMVERINREALKFDQEATRFNLEFYAGRLQERIQAAQIRPKVESLTETIYGSVRDEYFISSGAVMFMVLNEYFGFTQKEVNQILEDAAIAELAPAIKSWYDGYHFGNFDVYCPWDVMNYLRDLQYDPQIQPRSYWKNTSDNAIIRSFIDYAGSGITKKLETLLSGGYILQHVDDNLTYDYLHSSEDNLWSILYLTGYLTSVRKEDLISPLPEGISALTIPNAEIREIFETTIIKWFEENAKTWNRLPLFQAVWNGDSEALTQEMNRLLRKTISYHDYKEDFYHAFLAGIFTGAGYSVESNKEHGEGRSDIIVYDPVNGQAAVFEAKYSNALEHLESDCNRAIAQIDARMYAKELEDDYDHVFCYGIAFYKKRCLVKKKSD